MYLHTLGQGGGPLTVASLRSFDTRCPASSVLSSLRSLPGVSAGRRVMVRVLRHGRFSLPWNEPRTEALPCRVGASAVDAVEVVHGEPVREEHRGYEESVLPGV